MSIRRLRKALDSLKSLKRKLSRVEATRLEATELEANCPTSSSDEDYHFEWLITEPQGGDVYFDAEPSPDDVLEFVMQEVNERLAKAEFVVDYHRFGSDELWRRVGWGSDTAQEGDLLVEQAIYVLEHLLEHGEELRADDRERVMRLLDAS